MIKELRQRHLAEDPAGLSDGYDPKVEGVGPYLEQYQEAHATWMEKEQDLRLSPYYS